MQCVRLSRAIKSEAKFQRHFISLHVTDECSWSTLLRLEQSPRVLVEKNCIATIENKEDADRIFVLLLVKN